MKLLVITQVVDVSDSNLGFFHAWLKKMASKAEHIYVICLKKGEYALPDNVTVWSLGKEKGVGHWKYIVNFYRYIWSYRRDYDHVFVHMNPEYVVLAGWLWRVWHKKIALWYMHKAVNLKLRIAEKLVNRIFTASAESFRLPSTKVQIVGHGIDLSEFDLAYTPPPGKISLASVGRITPAKDLKTLIKGVAEFKKNVSVPVSLKIVGAPITSSDETYLDELKKLVAGLGLEKEVVFVGAIKHVELVKIYQTAQIFLHASQTGSMDKVVLEAWASGRPVISSSEAFIGPQYESFIFRYKQGDAADLARVIENVYKSGIVDPDKLPLERAIVYVKTNHNLDNVVVKFFEYFAL